MTEWPKEPIPGEDLLFMRVHRNLLKSGQLHPGVFRDHDGAMSTDWSRYSTPEDTLLRHKTPHANGVIQSQVGAICEIPGQRVEHSLLPENRAHTDVLGEKDVEARLRLYRISEWAIPPDRDSATGTPM
jgi:hypothetical protein